MTKPERKSITDLIATKSLARKPSAAEIDAIASKIHQPRDQDVREPSSLGTGKFKRMCFTAPVELYLKAKTKSTMQDQTLVAYMLRLIEEDVKR